MDWLCVGEMFLSTMFLSFDKAVCSVEAIDCGLCIGEISLRCSVARLLCLFNKFVLGLGLDLLLQYTSVEVSLWAGIGVSNTGFTLGSCLIGAAALVSGYTSMGFWLSIDVGLNKAGSTIDACKTGPAVLAVKLMLPLSGVPTLLEEGPAFVPRGSLDVEHALAWD